jgi:hypothetical protein
MNYPDSRLEPIRGQFRPVEAEARRELVAKLNTPLPDDYISFLTQYGGCGFAGEASIKLKDKTLLIFIFFDAEQLLTAIEDYADLAEDGKLAIAADMAGNPYVLDAQAGQVFFLDFTRNPPVGQKVAASFGEFLQSITVQPFA